MWMSVTGDAELDQAIQEMVDDGGAKGINAALRKAIREAVKEIVQPEVKGRVPHDEGTLESMIVVRAVKRSRGKVGYFVGFNDGSRPGQQKGSHYGWYIEFGTKVRIKKSNRQVTGKMKVDSFLRVPLYSNTLPVIAHVQRRLQEWVNEWNRRGK